MNNVKSNSKETNRFSKIIDAITRYSLGELVDDAQNNNKLDACRLAESLGQHDASTRNDDRWIDYLPSAFTFYPELKSAWELGWDSLVEHENLMAEVDEMRRCCPDVKEEHTLFCPHGHNAFGTTKGYDECAACGALMLPEYEEEYYDSLFLAGACM